MARKRYSAEEIVNKLRQAMVKRRTEAAGLGDRFSNHTFRGTGITAYPANDGRLKKAQRMANHASPTTTRLYDRRDQEVSLDDVEWYILLNYNRDA